jgi:hypothetical protein
VAEVQILDRMGVDAQAGMGFYRSEGMLGEALAGMVDFAKEDGRVPTLVQDLTDGRVLAMG